MSDQAKGLKESERKELVHYLTGSYVDEHQTPPEIPRCKGNQISFNLIKLPSKSNWGYETSRFVSESEISKDNVNQLRLKWAVSFPGVARARSLPTIAYGSVYVGSQDGHVYALDLETGCVKWRSRVSAEVRTGIVVESLDESSSSNPRAFFGDLLGRIHALDAFTGDILWSIRADNHSGATITGNPLLHENVLFVPVSSLEVLTAADPNYPCCTFRGSVVALDLDKGDIIWRHYTIPNPPAKLGQSHAGVPQYGPSGAAVWGSAAVDNETGVLYHGSSENYSSPADGNSDAVFAVDISTGRRYWQKQLLAGDAWNGGCYFGGSEHPNCPKEIGPDFDVSAPPLVIKIESDKKILVVGQKSGVVHGLDPSDDGSVLWRTRVGTGGVYGGIHFGMANEGPRVYVPIVDILIDSVGKSFEGEKFSGLHAINAESGDVLWSQMTPPICEGKKKCNAGISAAVTAIPGVVFAGHLDGMLRAYDGFNGDILWEIDTSLDFETVNGYQAHGGSISGPGPAVGDGHLLVNSGYDFGDQMPGSLLMTFSLQPLGGKSQKVWLKSD
jgi:polyvinyl alcohol dehydrogenase (cytochrome)